MTSVDKDVEPLEHSSMADVNSVEHSDSILKLTRHLDIWVNPGPSPGWALNMDVELCADHRTPISFFGGEVTSMLFIS